MKKLFIFVVLWAITLGGCAPMEKLMNGTEPTYDENGKRDNGVSPEIGGYLKEQVVLQEVQRMKSGGNAATFPSITEPQNGWLPGLIVNTSNSSDIFNVQIYSDESRTFKFGSVPVGARSYKMIWLPPGLNYYAEGDGGSLQHNFDVLSNMKTSYPFQGQNIPCYYYLYKQ